MTSLIYLHLNITHFLEGLDYHFFSLLSCRSHQLPPHKQTLAFLPESFVFLLISLSASLTVPDARQVRGMTTASVTAAVSIAVRPAEAECSDRGCGDGLGGEGEAAASEPPRDSVVAIDVPGVGADVDGAGDGKSEVEKVCRICHLSSGVGGLEVPNLIQLGCACKGELGGAHRRCAEAWFRVKGNRYCEICGANVKNVNGDEDGNFMESWNEGRMLGRSHRSSTEMNSCWRSQPFCNFLMACLVVAFILPWFFHINLF